MRIVENTASACVPTKMHFACQGNQHLRVRGESRSLAMAGLLDLLAQQPMHVGVVARRMVSFQKILGRSRDQKSTSLALVLALVLTELG